MKLVSIIYCSVFLWNYCYNIANFSESNISFVFCIRIGYYSLIMKKVNNIELIGNKIPYFHSIQYKCTEIIEQIDIHCWLFLSIGTYLILSNINRIDTLLILPFIDNNKIIFGSKKKINMSFWDSGAHEKFWRCHSIKKP